MDPLVAAVLGVVAIVAVNSLAPRVGVAAPLVLVLLGVGVSFLPFVPAIEVDPEWILGVVLPPLLYSSAVGMPTMDFRRDFRIISGLSVVLVVARRHAVLGVRPRPDPPDGASPAPRRGRGGRRPAAVASQLRSLRL